MIKVMLIDDEQEIRRLLHKMVEKQPDYQVVAECGDFAGAMADFARYRPDVVFVDIDLNGEDGLNCAKVLTELDPKLKVIFATAHSEYMANAFEIYAFDYLVKPFNMERVARTLERIRGVLAESGKQGQAGAPRGGRAEEGSGESDKISRSERYRGKLLIKGKEQAYLLDVEEILFVERTDGSTNIVTEGDQYRTSISLSDMEAKLDADQFMRCHKSYIVNLSKITRIEPYGRWTYVVKFRDCEMSALMTAQNYEKIKKIFS
ncbi:MAG: LytTR family DNA-binding domain-containing protein [Candidatus Gastranaerophilales bacterium]|nr:LytTR family DNA-binding domain-containing protein [Candidatus Gastranaerophilales bacterium]